MARRLGRVAGDRSGCLLALLGVASEPGAGTSKPPPARAGPGRHRRRSGSRATSASRRRPSAATWRSRPATRSTRPSSTSRSRTCSPPACSTTSRCAARAMTLVVSRGREPDHQPHRLRGQPAARRRGADHRRCSCGRASSTPARGCRTRSAASSSSTAATAASRATVEPKVIQLRAEPRRSGVRDQRRPADRRRAHQLHRQPGVQRRRAARRDPDQGSGLVPLPEPPTTPTTRIA